MNTVQEAIKKKSINELADMKEGNPLTIATELPKSSTYHTSIPLTPRQLLSCWLDPSELVDAEHEQCKMILANQKTMVSISVKEALERGERPRFVFETGFSPSVVKQKILRKYNITDVRFKTASKQITEIEIQSMQPIYDEDAHVNRVRNMLQAVHRKIPHVFFESVKEKCLGAYPCSMKVQKALKKMAYEAQGKEIEN